MENIQALREKAAKALADAQGFAKEMNEAKAKGETAKAAELETSFNRAYADFKAIQPEIQKAEAVAEVAAEYQRVQAPAAQAALKRRGVDTDNPSVEKLHREAFAAYLKRGEAGAAAVLNRAGAPAEMYALLGSQDDLGGFTVPEDFRSEVIKDMAGIAVFRSAGARVIPTSRDQLVFPTINPFDATGKTYSSGVAGSWRAQGSVGTDGTAPAVQNKPTFGQARIPVHIWQPDAIVVTQEFLDDSAIPVDSVLAELLAETRALDEDSAFINGSGSDRPQGILQAGLATVASGANDAVTYGGILDLYAAVPAQYRQTAVWLMNSATFGKILQLENTGGFNLFPPNTIPGQLLGKPVVFSEFMPDVGDATKPIVFGAFRYYVIAERVDFRIQRLVERYAPNVGVLATARLGGQVVRKNAFRAMLVS